MSSTSFRSILQQVTEEKLTELRIQKDLLTNHFSPALKSAEVTLSSHPKSSLKTLYEAIRDTPVKDTIDSILIDNVSDVLRNSVHDPSITAQLFTSWIVSVKEGIEHALRKSQYSYLYASLLTEWLALDEKRKGETKVGSDESDLEKKKEEEMTAAKEKMQRLMFSSPSEEEFEGGKFREFLTSQLFHFDHDPQGQEILVGIRRETAGFLNPENYVITPSDVQNCIRGLSAGNLLTPEKKSALKELGENTEALEEVASLLTSRLKNLERWDWPASVAFNLNIRRGLAGEWKGFLDEDVITALFLQYIGVEWAAFFKAQFIRIYNSRIWKKATDVYGGSVEMTRTEFHRQTFLAGLPDSVGAQGNRPVEEYAKVQASATTVSYQPGATVGFAGPPPPSGGEHMSTSLFGQQQQQQQQQQQANTFGFQQQQQAPTFGYQQQQQTQAHAFGSQQLPLLPMMCFPRPLPPPPPPKSDIDFKQSFLYILSTEIRLNQVLRPECPLIVVQADIESFTSTIIHEAVLITLESFNVSKSWLTFFKKFLQPETGFGTSGVDRIRRGVLEAHALSDVFAEVLTFLMDFLVNQKCNGLRIFRMSEEFWFWGPSEDVVKAWETVTSFGTMIGLRVNVKRSGSVAIFGEEEIRPVVSGPVPLPQKNIHWGYLAMHSDGTWQIHRDSLVKFWKEVGGLLDKSECVLEWINIFNKYMGFLKRNFGKCALIFGTKHMDQIIQSLQFIYEELFGSSLGGPVGSLKAKFASLQGMDIVDAWFHWPLERGGLGLVNPFIGVMALREAYSQIGDEDHFKKLPAEDKIMFEELCKVYDQKQQGSWAMPLSKKPTWEEYVAKRETGVQFGHWGRRYLRLLERLPPKVPSASRNTFQVNSFPIGGHEGEDGENYMMWLLTYYEKQLKLHFGTVDFINSKLLPMSMIKNIKKTKVQH